MKPFLLAAAMTLLYSAAITIVFRWFTVQDKAGIMFRAFAATIFLLEVCIVLTPPDLFVLPSSLASDPVWIDGLAGALFYAAAIFGGVIQLYNLAERGFSLRLLIDIRESPAGALSTDELYSNYGGGRGIPWMYQKRLDDVARLDLAGVDSGALILKERGHRVGRVFAILRDFLGAENGP